MITLHYTVNNKLRKRTFGTVAELLNELGYCIDYELKFRYLGSEDEIQNLLESFQLPSDILRIKGTQLVLNRGKCISLTTYEIEETMELIERYFWDYSKTQFHFIKLEDTS